MVILSVLFACSVSPPHLSDTTSEETSDQHPEPSNSAPAAKCPFRTDVRPGKGHITLTVAVDRPGIYALRPVTSFLPEDTYTVDGTQVVGYDPTVGAEVFPGEMGVIYLCDELDWVYVGDLDLTKLMDSPSRTTYFLTARRYNEDDTLRTTEKVEIHARVTGMTFHQ